MRSEPKVTLLNADQLDLAAYCLLQRDSFATLFQQNNISINYLTPAFFQWKYNTPAGKARIAFVAENGKMIASVAMYPVQLVDEGAVFKSWHFVEAATLPEARGRGLFKSCMQVLVDSLETDELIYVYPNNRSIKATQDIGFQQLQHLPFYAAFFLTKKRNRSFHSAAKATFSAKQDEYALSLAQNKCVMLFRNAAYMNWRYHQHPAAFYYSFAPEQDGKVMGNVVMRVVEIKKVRLLLVMEFHAKNEMVEKQLMNYVKEVASFEGCSFAGMFSTKEQRPSFFATGFVKLPSVVLPKRQILMGIQANQNVILNRNWFCQTGDWDAF